MINLIIADDSLQDVKTFEKVANTFSNIHVTATSPDPESIISKLAHFKPDLLVINTLLGNKNGIKAAKEIHKIHPDIHVIFLATNGGHALDAFDCKCNAFDYIIKPLDPEKIRNTLMNFEKHFETLILNGKIKACNGVLKFNTKSGYVLVKQKEIAYLLADQVYTYIYTIENRAHHISLNIGRIEPQLESSKFIRISRSAIVNVDYISEILRSKKSCILRWNGNTESIKLSKTGLDRLEMIFGKV